MNPPITPSNLLISLRPGADSLRGKNSSLSSFSSLFPPSFLHPSLALPLFPPSFAPAAPCLLAAPAAPRLLSYFVVFNLSLPCILSLSPPLLMPALSSATKQNQFIHPPLFPSFTPSSPACHLCFSAFCFSRSLYLGLLHLPRPQESFC